MRERPLDGSDRRRTFDALEAIVHGLRAVRIGSRTSVYEAPSDRLRVLTMAFDPSEVPQTPGAVIHGLWSMVSGSQSIVFDPQAVVVGARAIVL